VALCSHLPASSRRVPGRSGAALLEHEGKHRQVARNRLLIADDEDLFASLVEALLGSEPGIDIVGRAHNGEEAIALAEALAPDVIVMDIGMPVMDGIEATRRIRKLQPAVAVVIFTGSDEERDERRARLAGAAAFVRKAHIAALLLDAVRRAATPVEQRQAPAEPQRKLEAAIAF